MDTEKHYLEQLINKVSNIEELTDLVVHVCADKVKAEKCSLMLLDGKKKALSIVKAKGINEHVIRNANVKLGEGVAGFVTLSGETLLVADKENEGKFDSKTSERYKTDSFVSIPLKTGSDTIGVLNLTDKINNRNFSEKDINSLSKFISLASIAIKNALKLKELQELSVTDELTGLYNRRHFYNCLENGIERSGRYNRHFIMALIDIDKFKYINDTYGHQAGDSILKHISQILRTYTRSFDIVARYGGEEFAITFQEAYDYKDSFAGAISGLQFLERLRGVIENHTFTGIVPHKKLNITISCGAAIYPFDGMAKEELISKADENLYLAKRTGRNRTCVSREHLNLLNEIIQKSNIVSGSDAQTMYVTE